MIHVVHVQCTYPGRHAVPRLLDQRLVHGQLPFSVHRLQQRLRLLLLHLILHAEALESLRNKGFHR